MGALLLLYALKGQVTDKDPHMGLMFVDLKINSKATYAMIDTSVTHNFVVELKET